MSKRYTRIKLKFVPPEEIAYFLLNQADYVRKSMGEYPESKRMLANLIKKYKRCAKTIMGWVKAKSY